MKRRGVAQTHRVSRKRLLALLGMAAVLIAVAVWVRLYLAPKATPRQGEPQAPSPQTLIAALQQQVSFDPSDVRAHHALGEAYLAIGDYAQAESALRQALALAPQQPQVSLSLARALAKQGKEVEAKYQLEHIASAGSLDPRLLCQAGMLLLELSEPALGEKYLRQALKAAPKDAAPRLYWGHFCLLTEDESVAIKHFRKAAKLEPDLVPAWLALADAALKLGRLAEAEEAAREAVRLAPEQPEALCLMAQVELKKPASANALSDTRQILEKAVRLKPDYRDAHYYLGLTCLRLGDAKGAVAALEQTIALNPQQQLPARLNLARAYRLLGNHRAAEEQIKRTQPLLEFSLALSELQARLRWHPRDPNLHCRVGKLYLSLGERQAAQRAFLKALRFNPQHRLAKSLLAQLQSRKKEGDKTP
ncbi:MAG TPA: tetratricopeptide repeat protein [Chthonomonadales bacterium]|nr:tetratricopeptide repeat protein [Chthonomonadales bacterium]